MFYYAKNNDWNLFEQAINSFLPLYKENLSIYVNLAVSLFKKEHFKGAELILKRTQRIPDIPEPISKKMNEMILQISNSKKSI